MTRMKKILIKMFSFTTCVATLAFSACKGKETNRWGSIQEEQSSVSNAPSEEVSDSTDSDFATEEIEYALSDDGTYAIVMGYNGTEKKIYIDSSYDGVPVTEIADYAFYGYNEMTEVFIPKSVNKIGFSAFDSDAPLSKITLPFIGETKDGTENVHFGYIFGANDYTENKNFVPETLQEVWISDCTYIGDYAFRECEHITHIVLPDTLTTVGYGTFHTCSSLLKIVIPRSVTSFGNYSFAYCYNAEICCEVEKKPSGWDVMWDYGYPVTWGYTGEK